MPLLDAVASERAISAPEVEAASWSWPAAPRGAAGHAYWRLPDGRLALFLGDASDHGGAGPSVIGQVREHLRALSEERTDPEWLLAQANQRLQSRPPPGRFVTAFLGCLGQDGELHWCSAGQGPVYVSRRARDDYDALPASSLPLGVEPDLRPRASVLRLRPGGRVVVLSDGIFDAANDAGQLLGPRRIKTVLDNTAGLPLEKVLSLVRDVLNTWQGASGAAGDQSLLVAGLTE